MSEKEKRTMPEWLMVCGGFVCGFGLATALLFGRAWIRARELVELKQDYEKLVAYTRRLESRENDGL